MTTQHTPGPWTVNSMTRIEGPSYGLIASVRGALDEQRTHANARLIAAAPDMLAACERAIEIMAEVIAMNGSENAAEARQELRAAIAKARGL